MLPEMVMIDPPWNSTTMQYDMTGNTYGPATTEWEYTDTPAQEMYSNGLSSCQRLKNGNTLISVGRYGRTFEITPSEEKVWEYPPLSFITRCESDSAIVSLLKIFAVTNPSFACVSNTV